MKKTTYVEPKGYFNSDMKKAINEWEKKNANKGKSDKKKSK